MYLIIFDGWTDKYFGNPYVALRNSFIYVHLFSMITDWRRRRRKSLMSRRAIRKWITWSAPGSTLYYFYYDKHKQSAVISSPYICLCKHTNYHLFLFSSCQMPYQALIYN